MPKRCENMSIGERITQLRKEAAISQGQLAESLGVSRQAVSKWENDLSSPDTINLIRLAEVLNSEVEYIATGRKPVYEHPIVVNLIKKNDDPSAKNEEKIVKKQIPVSSPSQTVVRRVIRTRYIRNPLEFGIIGVICFFIGLGIGLLL